MPSFTKSKVKIALSMLVLLVIALALFSTSMIPGHAAGTGNTSSTRSRSDLD